MSPAFILSGRRFSFFLPFILLTISILVPRSALSQDVDPLTGRAIINIPLGSISALDLSVSVSLSHHGGALRVTEGAGSAGMGWSVVSGGSVSREVRGLPDDFSDTNRKGWLLNGSAQTIQNFTSTSDDNLSVCTDETTDWTTLNGLAYSVDTEPDVFYFQAPGISGKFIFGTDGLPKLIPYQDLQITFAANQFIIKTSTGVVYTFGLREDITRKAVQIHTAIPVNYFKSDYSYYQVPVIFASSWNLSSIQSLSSGAVASFNYQDGTQYVNSQYMTGINPGTTVVDTLYALQDTGTPRQLSQISLKNYSITLAWANSLVSKVTLYESETGDIKEYNLLYKSITSVSDTKFPPVAKPFLMQVKQQNSCVAFPSYLFNYTGIDTTLNQAYIPWRTGWGQDHFGYYNGQKNNQNIPTVYFYQLESGARRFRVTPIPSVAATQTLTGIAGTDRNVNSTYTAYGSLNSIYYPTGGATYIGYEANKYFDSSTSEELYGPGLRVASITTSGGDYAFGKPTGAAASSWHSITKTYQYSTTDANTTTSGKIVYPPVFAFTDGASVFRSQSDLGPGSEVMYSRVKEVITGQGYRVYNYDLPNGYPDATSAATPSKVARASGATCAAGILQNGAYTWPFAPVTDYNFKRGFLTRISEYSQAGVLTQEKRMTYSIPQANVTIKGVRKESMTDAQNTTVFHFSTYLIPVSQSRILSQEVTKQIGDESVADSTKVTTAYVYNALNRITQTTQTNDDASLVKSYMKYAGDYAITSPTAGDVQANALFKLNAGNRSGEVIESYQTYTPIGGTATVTGGRLNLFKDYGTYVWPYQAKHFPAGQVLTASSVAAGATQGFVSDTDYIPDATVEYANALPVTSTGVSMISSAVHYSTGTSLPLATFGNCRAEQAVYDGFELASTHGLTYTGSVAPANPAGWTGKKSVLLDGTYSLVTLNPVSKGEGTYRISLWANSATAGATITIKAKDVSTVQSTITLTCPSASQWTYLEGEMNMSSVSASFSFEVSSASSIRIDDFTALPKSAVVSLKTYQPLTGVTSQTDDRGNSVVMDYDIMGRPTNTFDEQRNLVEKKEYGLQKQGKVVLNASFTSNTSVYNVGDAVVFTAGPTCVSSAIYTWTFITPYGVQTTTSGSYVFNTFSLIGEHAVTLTVISPDYATQSYTQSVCVVLTGSVQIGVAVSNATIYQCDAVDDRIRMFTASVPGIPHIGMGGPPVSYTWFITNASGVWINSINVSGATKNGNVLTYASPAFTYQVRCDVQFSTSQSMACGYNVIVGSGTSGVTFVSQSQCQ